MKNLHVPHQNIVLIDDDPIFCTIMAHQADSIGITLDYFTSILEMADMRLLDQYALGIVDYDLGAINGVELAQYVPCLLGDLPLILVSAYDQAELPLVNTWPKNVVGFLNKKLGSEAIVRISKAAVDRFGGGNALPPKEFSPQWRSELLFQCFQ